MSSCIHKWREEMIQQPKPVGPDPLKGSEDKAEGSDMIDVKGENPKHVSSAQKSVYCF